VHVALTDEGLRVFEGLAAEHEAEVNALFAGLSDEADRRHDRHPETDGGRRHDRTGHLKPQHFLWDWQDRVATIRLNRPDRKNPLTFDSYAELRDTFRALAYATDVDVVVFASNGGTSVRAAMCTTSSARWWAWT
jgi:hypothetical protein